MSTQVQALIAQLQQNKISQNAQNVVAQIDVLIAALQTLDNNSAPGQYLPLAGGTMSGGIVGEDGGTWNNNGINNLIIGLVTPKTGIFGALNANGLFTPNGIIGISGTPTNNNVQAGSVGEYISQNIAPGAAVNLATGVATNIAGIALTAGDWDVMGNVALINSGAATATVLSGWISATSATSPADANGGARFFTNTPQAVGSSLVTPVGELRISLAATTTIYLSASATFTGGTFTGYGFIGARRRR